jgi:hypothetical protein
MARRTVPFLVPALLTVVATALAGAEGGERGFRIESPGARLGPDGMVAVGGAVARLDGRMLLADAIRYDLAADAVWASGNVVYRMPGVRITAARLGARPRQHSGDAWEVEAVIQSKDRRMVVRAEHIEWRERTLVLHHVTAGFGHGGIIGFWMPRMTITLAEGWDEVRRTAKGSERGKGAPAAVVTQQAAAEAVDGIELLSPAVTLVHVPVMWLPWMYRDFSRDYPWSQVRFGESRRLGYFIRYWVGTDLPAFAGWKTSVEARGDLHSIAGGGAGARLAWSNDRWGTGDIWAYRQPAEHVRGGPGNKQELEVRQADFVDAEHRLPLLFGPGAGAAYGRFTALPDPDPTVPGWPADTTGLRWMSDYFPERLERRPPPQRGGTAAYGVGPGTLVVDTVRRPNDAIDMTERWHSVQAVVPPVQLLGPVHLAGQVWEEDLHRQNTDTSANRINWQSTAMASKWWGGFGADAQAGIKGLTYGDGVIAGVEQPQWQNRRQGVADGGVSVRLAESFGDGWKHIITPRLGLQLLGQGVGDALPVYAFGDPRDSLEEDKRFLTAGFSTSLAKGAPLFRAEFLTRWALRDQERWFTDAATGASGFSSHRLVDITGTAEGAPVRDVTLVAAFKYDARQALWERVNAGIGWNAARWTQPRYDITIVPATSATARTIEQGPGLALVANRYRFDGSLLMGPGGAAVDKWRLKLLRHMVDGDLQLGFEVIHDPVTGAVTDRRATIGFALGINEKLSTPSYGLSF